MLKIRGMIKEMMPQPHDEFVTHLGKSCLQIFKNPKTYRTMSEGVG